MNARSSFPSARDRWRVSLLMVLLLCSPTIRLAPLEAHEVRARKTQGCVWIGAGNGLLALLQPAQEQEPSQEPESAPTEREIESLIRALERVPVDQGQGLSSRLLSGALSAASRGAGARGC